MLTTPVPSPPPGSGFPTPPRAFFAGVFKIPTLWGVKHTAPYFHDNSMKTLEEVAEHYAFYFRNAGPFASTSPRRIRRTWWPS